MKKIILVTICSFCILVTVATVVFTLKISKNFKKSEPFLYLQEWIKKNPPETLGTEGKFETSWFVSGKVTDEDAYFKFSMKTGNSSYVVYATLKHENEWNVVRVKYKPK